MILVTGASGLLGIELINALASKNLQVKAIYLQSTPPSNPSATIEWIKGDILDVSFLDEIMKGIDQVYHCAGLVSFHESDKEALYKINVEGTANIVNACINNGVKKLLHVSSVAALGRMREDTTINEKMTWTEETNNSYYGKTKYLAELEVFRGIAEGLNAVIVNPSIILGAGNWNKGSTELFQKAYKQFPWYTNGSTGFIDVLDAVEAMQIIMRGINSGERFILNSQNLTYKEVLTHMAEAFGKKPPHKEATPFLISLICKWEGLKSKITGKKPLITKETAASATAKVQFDNSKLRYYALNLQYTPIEKTIKRICKELKQQYQLS